MLVVALCEEAAADTRAPLSPDSAKKLTGLGFEVWAETGIGLASDFVDRDYDAAGAKRIANRDEALAKADVILRTRKPPPADIPKMKRGAIHISFLNPFEDLATVQAMAEAGLTTISMEMMPRTTLAQKMDALSSQANLAGYYSVILSAEKLNKILPMLMTPAGTISPARYFIVGVGVAGLQAIATAKRLGARVEAFDTRPVVEEQVKSLGAKFVKIDVGETGQTEQGYAKELTPEQIERQQRGMAKVCAQNDVVITTAKIFGKKAPTLITSPMIQSMRWGSVIIDLAVESGGNVQGSVLGKEVITENGVKILGLGNFEGRVARDATLMYAANLYNFIEHFWDRKAAKFNLDLGHEILKGCVLSHGGGMVHEKFRP